MPALCEDAPLTLFDVIHPPASLVAKPWVLLAGELSKVVVNTCRNADAPSVYRASAGGSGVRGRLGVRSPRKVTHKGHRRSLHSGPVVALPDMVCTDAAPTRDFRCMLLSHHAQPGAPHVTGAGEGRHYVCSGVASCGVPAWAGRSGDRRQRVTQWLCELAPESASCTLGSLWRRGSLPLHNLVSDSANPHYVSDPLPRHCGIIVALDSSEP